MLVTRAEAIDRLKQSAARIHGFGATALYVFGSAARGELGPGSDVDIFVDHDADGPFSFVELIQLQCFLAEVLQREADLTTRVGSHRRLRADIARSSIQVL